MTDPYIPVTGTALARLADRIAWAAISERPELRHVFEDGACRIDDIPGGVAFYIGDQCIARLTTEQVAWAVEQEEARSAS